jgi:hypothetical protein
MSVVNIIMRNTISGDLLNIAANFEGYIDFEIELDYAVADIIVQLGEEYEFYKVIVI